ncbi:MAG: hypothetical protein ABJF04_07955 [Reichenbachiella sp.]|uniref:hypothetical protein n=1 Tax=Reichenbachiella sp. TaxID=2184521 RepID=UPI003264F2D3
MGILSQLLNAIINFFILKKQDEDGKEITSTDNIISPTAKIALIAVLIILILKAITFLIKMM